MTYDCKFSITWRVTSATTVAIPESGGILDSVAANDDPGGDETDDGANQDSSAPVAVEVLGDEVALDPLEGLANQDLKSEDELSPKIRGLVENFLKTGDLYTVDWPPIGEGFDVPVEAREVFDVPDEVIDTAVVEAFDTTGVRANPAEEFELKVKILQINNDSKIKILSKWIQSLRMCESYLPYVFILLMPQFGTPLSSEFLDMSTKN